MVNQIHTSKVNLCSHTFTCHAEMRDYRHPLILEQTVFTVAITSTIHG